MRRRCTGGPEGEMHMGLCEGALVRGRGEELTAADAPRPT